MDETKGTHRPQPQAYTSPRWESAPCFSTYLEVYEERKLVATIRIDTRSHFLVGRNAHDCDIVFEPHSKVSRTHAAIVHHTNGEVYVIDLKSGHGTYLNGDQVPANKPTRLVDGYKLEFAKDTGITFTVRVLAGKIPGSEQPKGTLTLLLKEPVMVTALGRDRGTSQGDDEGVPGAGSHGRNGDGGAESPQEGERAAKRRHVADSRGHGHEEGHAPASGKVVRCRHLLLKHVESKNPVTHRVTDTRSADRPDKWQVTRTKEEAVAEIEDYLAELRSMVEEGASGEEIESRFSQMASQISDCKSSTRGGDLGEFGPKKMQPPFEKAAFALAVGDISPIVHTPNGVHIILRTG